MLNTCGWINDQNNLKKLIFHLILFVTVYFVIICVPIISKPERGCHFPQATILIEQFSTSINQKRPLHTDGIVLFTDVLFLFLNFFKGEEKVNKVLGARLIDAGD